jgi:hypothetical protein
LIGSNLVVMAGKFIIYGLIDPITGHLRYVGKSCSGLKRPQQHTAPSRTDGRTYKECWIRGLRTQGLRPAIVVLQETDREILSGAEVFWIAYFRAMGCPLTNLTDGGDGCSGWRASAETKHRMSRASPKRLSVKTENEIANLYTRGVSVRATARAQGVSYGAVLKTLGRRGIARRSISEAQSLRHAQRG